MIIPLEPNLEGLAERRFFSFARQMLDRQAAGDAEGIRALVESETRRAAGLGELRGQCEEYTACVRVLGDLAQLRWQLAGLVAGVRDAVADAVDGDEDMAIGRYDAGADERAFEIEIERDVLTWVHHFCSEDAWGGFFESATASFEEAISGYAQCEPTLLRSLQPTIAHVGKRYDLASLIGAMERELHERGMTAVALGELWDSIVAARREVLRNLDMLIHQPMLAVAGDTELRGMVGELLSAWEQFYAKLAQHHPEMHEIDHAWTQTLFEAVAALDVVQIKASVDAGRTSWKAVLLPTHPLHLWRYEKIAVPRAACSLRAWTGPRYSGSSRTRSTTSVCSI